ncbi:hypothetical protein C3L33_17230, partial [Rhododendron williamsianum]
MFRGNMRRERVSLRQKRYNFKLYVDGNFRKEFRLCRRIGKRSLEGESEIIFSPEAACEVIEAEEHSHVFYEAEPDIWMVMIVEKSKESEAIWRIDALRGVLKEVHSLFMMFNGPIRALLDKEPAGGLIRSHLYTFIMDYLSDFLVGKKLQLPNFRDSLRERGTVQMLTIGREAAIEVQEDTINLFTYAVLRLSPRALPSAVSSWSYLRKGNVSSHAATGSISANSGAVLDQFYRSHNSSSAGDPGYNVARPLQPDKWTKGKDGFLVSGIWNTEAGSSTPTIPTIWLQQTGERMYLCVFQHRNLTLILLIPVTSIPNGEQAISIVKQQILENASVKIDKVEEKLSKGWGGENAYHAKTLQGVRIMATSELVWFKSLVFKLLGRLAEDELQSKDQFDDLLEPKQTHTQESLVALTKLREEVDLEKSRAKWDGPDQDKDLEISIRAKNNAWVIGRVTRGKELYMVLEKANETLLYASDAVENFSNRYCNGSFSLD